MQPFSNISDNEFMTVVIVIEAELGIVRKKVQFIAQIYIITSQKKKKEKKLPFHVFLPISANWFPV